MYNVYLNRVLLPLAPEKIDIKQSGGNKTATLLDGSEINILKSPKLKDVNFDALLPNVRYPFASYPNGFHDAAWYIKRFERMRGKNIKLVITRTSPGGKRLYQTSMRVTLEDFTIKEDRSGSGFDQVVSFDLKEYVHYGTQVVTVTEQTATQAAEETPRADDTTPKEQPAFNGTYTVKKGDTLWKIAKHYYGDGAQYPKIVAANPAIKNPDLIYPGQVFNIP